MSFNITTETNPDWLNKGDNAWQLTAASLVGLQSIPGLVIIYAGKCACLQARCHFLTALTGLVKSKWAVNSAFMCFYAFAMTLLIWVVWGYKMGFGKHMIPGLVGIPGPVLSSHTELQQVRSPVPRKTAAA